jgi:hypothetical protein
MHKNLIYAAFGWLAFSGSMHFIIDVLSQYIRGKRVPGAETTFYYGLNTSYALGQMLFALVCLFLARRAPDVLDSWPMMALSLAAASAWLAITFAFMGYWEPKMNAAIFGALLIAAIATAK